MSGLDLKEGAKVNLDIKTLVGIVFAILTVAGIWFSLKAELSQLQIDVFRMQMM